jgi:hypothetical protein
MSFWEESMAQQAGVNGVYYNLRKENTKTWWGPGGMSRQRACFSSPDTFKTYANL